MTLDKQITIGFLIMLAIIVLVSGFCMYSISGLKNTRTTYGEEEFSISEIISAFSEEENKSGDDGITGENIIEALKIADNQIGVAYINIFVVASLAVLFGGIVTIMFPRRVTKPILRLVSATENVQEGDYSYRVEKIGSTDEVARLVKSFNRMLQSIEDEYNQIEEKNIQLKEKNDLNRKLLQQTEKFNDVLEEKIEEVKNELENKQKELIEAERMATIGVMATKIAHEVRNPLSGIAVALENLKKRVTTNEKHEMINEIISEISRLDRIIIELFQLAIPRDIKLVEGDPNELVEKVIEIAMPQIKSKSITLEKNLALPSRTILLDFEQIHQVLVNLLLNSVQAISSNDGKITITTKFENSYLIFEIRDTGHGIEKKHLQKIFEPFFSTKEEGSGLGLPISLRIIQAHNGTISVKSDYGKGSVFTVTLPVDLTENSVHKT